MSDKEHLDSNFTILKGNKRQRGTVIAVVGILTKLKQADIPDMKS